MAFFKFRKGGDEHTAPAAAPESVEAMRTRARHRLIGASVLVLLGVVGFPLLFDGQPRPISVDIPIEIPDKNTLKPLVTSSQAKAAVAAVVTEPDAGKPMSIEAAAPALATSRASNGPVIAASGPGVAAIPKVAAKSEAEPDKKPESKPDSKAEAKPSDKPIDRPTSRTDDGAKAQALLEGKDAAAAPATAPATASASAPLTNGRFVVQIGAFSDAAKAQEARLKLERAGLKTYTQVVQPKEGKRIRVRVGPFETKAEADRVAEKIKKLDLPAAILEL